MTAIARRLRALIALAGLCACVAACGGVPPLPATGPMCTNAALTAIMCTDDDLEVATSALNQEEVDQSGDVWAYFTGSRTINKPPFSMVTAQPQCGYLNLGGGKKAYRIGLQGYGTCAPDILVQGTTFPYAFRGTYESWDTAYTPLQPFYATLAINALCIAAYRGAGWSDAQLQPYCGGAPGSSVDYLRHWLWQTYHGNRPYWTAGV